MLQLQFMTVELPPFGISAKGLSFLQIMVLIALSVADDLEISSSWNVEKIGQSHFS